MNITKLNPKGNKVILVSYSPTSHLYEVYNINTRKTTWTRDITILESQFLLSNSLNTTDNIPQTDLEDLSIIPSETGNTENIPEDFIISGNNINTDIDTDITIKEHTSQIEIQIPSNNDKIIPEQYVVDLLVVAQRIKIQPA